jgi:hypothetical protein
LAAQLKFWFVVADPPIQSTHVMSMPAANDVAGRAASASVYTSFFMITSKSFLRSGFGDE